MAADIQPLGLEVKATGIKTAANNLNELGNAAAKHSQSIANIESALQNLSKTNLQQFATELAGISSSLKTSNTSLKDFSSSMAGFKGGSQSFTTVATAADSLANNADRLGQVAQHLKEMQTALSGMQGMASGLRSVGSVGSGGSRSGGSSGASEDDKLAKAQASLLRSIQYRSIATTEGTAALMEYKAAQAGITEQAAPFISRMRQTEIATNTLGMSQKGYNAALRNVPAQFTDIIVSLQGGQRPLTVLLQQGGQLKDMFGGTTNAMKAMGSYLMTLINPYTLLAAASVALGYGFYQASQRADALTKSLTTTNGYAGITQDTLISMGRSSENTALALQSLVGSGKVTGDQLGVITKGVLDFASATGEKIPAVAKHFESLAESPSKSIAKLNEQYHFLTLEVYKQITALEQQGKKTEAATLAQVEFSKAAANMNKNTNENLSALGRYFKTFGDSLTTIKDQINNLFFKDTKQEQVWAKNLEIQKEHLVILKAQEAVASAQQSGSAAAVVRAQAWLATVKQERAVTIDKLTKERDLIQGNVNAENAQAKAKADKQKAEDAAIAAQEEADKKRKSAEERAKREAEREAERLRNSAADYRANKASIEEKIAGLQTERNIQLGLATAQEKSNEFLVQASKLEQQAKDAKTQQEAAQYRSLAAEYKRAGALQQTITAEEKLTKEKEKQDALAIQLRTKYGSQFDIIEGQRLKAVSLLESAKSLDDVERSRLISIENQNASLEKQKLLAQFSGDPRKVVEVDYQTNLAKINQTFDPVTQHAEQQEAIQALDQETNDKRIAAYQAWMKTQGLGMSTLLSATQAISGQMGTQLTGLINGSNTANDALNALGNTILSSVVSSITEWGIKELWRLGVTESTSLATQLIYDEETASYVVNQGVQTTAAGVATTSRIGMALAEAASWIGTAFASMTAAMGFLGPFAPVGALAALTAGVVGAQQLASSVMHDNGGTIAAGQIGIVGEYGPELVRGPANVTSRKDTAKALTGNGNVTIVNQTSASISSATVTKDSRGEMIVTLQEILPGMMAGELGNPKSKSVKALGSHTQLTRS